MDFFAAAPVAPPAELGFATLSLDRAALKREDAEWLRRSQALTEARFLAICKDVPVLAFDGLNLNPWFKREEIDLLGDRGDPLFLGLEDGEPRFAFDIAPERFDALKERHDLKLIDMRSIAMQGLFAPGLLNAIGTAKAMLLWHNRHRFCSACGKPSDWASAGWKRHCSHCGADHFPRTDPVVIMLAIRGDSCLLGRSAHFPEGRYSCLAGFMEPGEGIEDAVRREILEETAITTGRVRYLYAQPWPFPSSLMIGCLAEATSTEITIDPTELADARWFSREEARQILQSSHPQGISSPPRMAIANHILQAFVDAG
jgi:NAD+ diphosphatase